MDAKQQLLNDFLAKNGLHQPIADKMSATSYATPNFSYGALRIGNSIGDSLDIGLTMVLAETITQHFGLTLYTVEHCEFHTRGTTEQDLEKLAEAAMMFEKIRHSTDYKALEKKTRDVFMQNVKAMIH